MPPLRKYKSGSMKRKEKQKEEQLIKSQRGALDKFILKEQPVSTQDSVEEGQNNENEQLTEDQIFNDNESSDGDENVGDMDCDATDASESDKNDNSEEALNEFIDEAPEQVPSNLYDPRIWDGLDAKWRDLLAIKGHVRDVSITKGTKDGFNRCFSSSLYTKNLSNGESYHRDWLVYCKEIDKVFCFCCKLFKKKPMQSQLANDGYGDWSHTSVRLNQHEVSRDHVHNMAIWMELQLRMEKGQTIDRSLQDHVKKEKEHWRKLLQRLISIVKYLAKYNLAFRGTNQKIYQDNNGNFMGLVQFVAKYDEVIQEHLRRVQSKEIRYHYLSNVIQNELILMISVEVKGAIIKKDKDAKYYSIILDCTPDISHQEQMTLVFRCVDITANPVKVEEYFIQFLKVNDTTGLGIFEELQLALTGLGLEIDDVRGQGYDNGSNMKGYKQGVQRRLLDVNPRAFYTPCGCHSLNLTLCDIANCCGKARDFFGVVQRIYSLFANSTKRWQILKDNLIGVTLKPLSTTRWESRVESVKAIQSQPLQIRQALLQLAESDNDTKIRSEAKSLAKYELGDFEFLLGMTIWYTILATVNKVSKRLQEKDIPVDVAMELVNGLILFFSRKYRETGFSDEMIIAKRLAIDLGVDPVFPERREICQKVHFDEVRGQSSKPVRQSGEEHFRVHYFLVLVDDAIGSLERRFEQYQTYEKIFGFLLRPEKLSAYHDDDLKSCCVNLANNLKNGNSSDVDGDELFVELKLLQEILPSEDKKSIDVLNFVKRMNCFPATSIAYRILLTIPITVASAERSFSKLKILKSYLRSTMLQERLNGLALLSIESEFLDTIDYEGLIDEFAAKNARRKIFQ